VNAKGWDAHAAYARISLPIRGEEGATMWDRVSNALSYYQHVANVEADNEEDVFRVTNIGPEDQIERVGRMRSCSVGDVLYNVDTGEFIICASFGWELMTPASIGTFLSTVATRLQVV